MVKPKGDLSLALAPQSLTIDANQDCAPVTPVNRSFTNVDTNSFVTAILSPSSHDVFAARARARSRSDAPPISSTAALNAASRAVHCSPSLDSIVVPRPCDTISEGDTSPIKAEEEGKAVVLKPIYDSPSFARRSRLLSSTGGHLNASIYDSFAPLTLNKIGEGEVAVNDTTMDDAASHRLLSSRPRASTLSVPNSAQLYPSLADFSISHGNATPSAAAKYSKRLRTSSHYGLSESSSNNNNEDSRDRSPSALNLHGLNHTRRTTSSSSKCESLRPLSTQSSHGSLYTRYDSSFESSFGVSDLSMTLSNSFSETLDTSNETVNHDHSTWRHLQHIQDSDKPSGDEAGEGIFKVSENITGASSNVSIASHSTLQIITGQDHQGRRKSHTISGVASPQCMALRVQHHDQQDVFGPTSTLEDAGQMKGPKQAPVSLASLSPVSQQSWTSKPSSQLTVKKDNKPRRLTMGGGIPSTVKGNSRAALYQPHKPDSPLQWHRTPIKGRAPVLSIGDPVTSDQSVTAFQELIDAMRKERPIKSTAIQEVTSAEPKSIGAVLEYRRRSPTGQSPEESGQDCQLCGSVARRLTMLEPCGHLACAVCCSSGLNQVTATPPRPHLCAACHTHVQGITLRREPKDYDPHSTPLQTPRGLRNRPQTPSPDEQRLLYRHPASPSLLKGFPKTAPAIEDIQRRRAGSNAVPLSKMSTELIDTPAETSSSDLFTEDQPFYQSQRTLLQQQHLINQHRILPSLSPVSSTISPRGQVSSEAVVLPREEGPPRSTTAQGTSIVRVDNIPWTVTYNDIIEWLPQPSDCILPDSDVSSASIHIPIDLFTGKTSNCCFVECKNKEEAMRLVRHRNNHRLLGRPVNLIITTLEDLLNEIFPARVESPSQKDHECIFFTAIHLRQLIDLLKRGGIQLKGPLKIVDVTTSMIRLVPANLSRILSDMLFHRAIEIVCICIAASQEMPAIRQSLDRLLLACSSCACFTVSQRIEILDSARGTLTAVTQAKRIAAPFDVTPFNFARHPASSRVSISSSSTSTAESPGGAQRVASWQANQRMRLSSEAALLQHQASLGPSVVNVEAANAALASPFLSKGPLHASTLLPPFTASGYSQMKPAATPPRQRSMHQPSSPVDARHREAAFRTLLSYGITPTSNADGFEHMLNEIAQAFAKQQIKS